MTTRQRTRLQSFGRTCAALAAFAFVSAGAPVAAEEGANVEARARFLRGVELYEAGEHSAALAEFTRAHELRPHYAILLNIAQCYANIGRYAEAIDHLRRYLEEGGGEVPPPRRAEVEAELARLEALFGLLDVRVSVAGAAITVDGAPAGTSPIVEPLRVRSGLRVVEARLEGHQPARRELTVAGGERLAVDLDLAPVARAGRVRVEAGVPGAVVFVDGIERGPAPWEGALAGGEHVVEARAAGFRPAQRTLRIVPGTDETVALTPTAATSGGTAHPRRRLSQAWFWSALAFAVLAGGGAAATGALALGAEADLHAFLDDVEAGHETGTQATLELRRLSLVDDTRSLALATDVLIGVAAVAALAAVALAVFTRFGRSGDRAALRVAPSLAVGGAALVAAGRF